jgi:dTMP kinase
LTKGSAKNKFGGKFIVLDGLDGCGKSVQTKLLADWLTNYGIETVVFRDPGTTDVGEKIRQILLTPGDATMSTRTELLLYMAARAQLWQEKISPALKQNRCVILDRWLSSTCAYQGCAGGFGIDNVINIAQSALERLWPDLTIILDIDPKSASQRLNRALDRMEQKGDEYRRKVREGFLTLAEQEQKFAVVDASEDIRTIHKKVLEVISKADL